MLSCGAIDSVVDEDAKRLPSLQRQSTVPPRSAMRKSCVFDVPNLRSILASARFRTTKVRCTRLSIETRNVAASGDAGGGSLGGDGRATTETAHCVPCTLDSGSSTVCCCTAVLPSAPGIDVLSVALNF